MKPITCKIIIVLSLTPKNGQIIELFVLKNKPINSLKKWGASLVSLGDKVVVEQFPQENAGEGSNNAQNHIKSGGVSFFYHQIVKNLLSIKSSKTEVIHVK